MAALIRPPLNNAKLFDTFLIQKLAKTVWLHGFWVRETSNFMSLKPKINLKMHQRVVNLDLRTALKIKISAKLNNACFWKRKIILLEFKTCKTISDLCFLIVHNAHCVMQSMETK